jgi:hypothetical protein
MKALSRRYLEAKKIKEHKKTCAHVARLAQQRVV